MTNQLLIGFTDQRGTSAFADSSFRNGVPFDSVANMMEIVADDTAIYTNYTGSLQPVVGKRAIVSADTGDVWNIVSDKYAIHQYSDVLLRSTQNFLSVDNGDVQIAAAGLADNGGVGFIQLQLPSLDVIDTLRPTLTLATSHTGRFATMYKIGLDRLFCTNQLGLISNSHAGSGHYSFRHTLNSHVSIEQARDAVQSMIFNGIDNMAEVRRLMDQYVDLDQVLPILVPKPHRDSNGEEPSQVSMTRWVNKIQQLWSMYEHDARVAPWRNTGWGVYQLFSTYRLWESAVRTSESPKDRFSRNMLSYLGGQTDDFDRRVLNAIERVSG